MKIEPKYYIYESEHMKWYLFIRVAWWLGVFMNAVSLFENAAILFRYMPLVVILTIASTLLLASGLYGLWVKKWFGVIALCASYAVNMLLDLVLIAYGDTVSDVLGNFLACIVLIAVNYIYFARRRPMFSPWEGDTEPVKKNNEKAENIPAAYVPEEKMITDEKANDKEPAAIDESEPDEMEQDISRYIREVYEPEIRYSSVMPFDNYNVAGVSKAIETKASCKDDAEIELDDIINMSFVDAMMEYMITKNKTSPKVYKAALIDRKLFSKIISDKDYKPSKDTCIALIFALELDLDDATDMLNRAGYTLSHSIKRDVVIEYFFRHGIYDLMKINDILDRMGFKILCE